MSGGDYRRFELKYQLERSNRGGVKTNNGHLRGEIVGRVLGRDFERFHRRYQAAKSPTVNNLPRTKSNRTFSIRVFGVPIVEIKK